MIQESWTLTDVANGYWVDSFLLRAQDLKLPNNVRWSIGKRILRGGLRNGVEVVEIDNGALSCVVIPTRGMSLWRGEYHGLGLGWDAPVMGPVHPKWVNLQERNGLGWLQGFDEWIVRCGLGFIGPPGEDRVNDDTGASISIPLTLHGRIANLPAHFVEISAQKEAPYAISVTGHVQESMLFHPHFELRSKLTTWPGSNKILILDEVVNLGSSPAEMQLLYHCNFGAPFLEPGSRLVTAFSEMAPRDMEAVRGLENFETYAAPTPGFSEQVYYYRLLENRKTRRTLVMLCNSTEDLGVALRYRGKELPCFSQWKNTAAREDGYVTGLEPATSYPNFRQFEREQGRVPVIEPGSGCTCELELEFHDHADEVQRLEDEIRVMQGEIAPHVSPEPVQPYSPVG